MGPEHRDIGGWHNKNLRDGAIAATKPDLKLLHPTVTSTANLHPLAWGCLGVQIGKMDDGLCNPSLAQTSQLKCLGTPLVSMYQRYCSAMLDGTQPSRPCPPLFRQAW